MAASKPTAVGIDVAKRSLSVCFLYRDGSEKTLNLRNSAADIAEKILPRLKNFTGRIVMESTGHYHWPGALILTQKGLNVYVVNPLLAKQYLSTNIRKVKTDPADAFALARMARLADNLPAPFDRSAQSLWLRKKLALIASLDKQIIRLSAALGGIREAGELIEIEQDSNSVLTEIETTLSILKKQLKSLEKEFVSALKADESSAGKNRSFDFHPRNIGILRRSLLALV